MISRSKDELAALVPPGRASVDELLADLRDGRRQAMDELFPLLYRELHDLAHRQRRALQAGDTLNTTALVHEAYLKLVDQRRATFETEAHFLAAAAQAIRHILINYARDQRTQKRGGAQRRLPYESVEFDGSRIANAWEDRLLELDEALNRLGERSARQAHIVVYRFYGGMTVEQAAKALGLSTATVMRSWAVARAWLHRQLRDDMTAGDA